MKLSELITPTNIDSTYYLRGEETYPQDIPAELERLAWEDSGLRLRDVKMPKDFSQDLEEALAPGSTGLTVTWFPEKGWNFRTHS